MLIFSGEICIEFRIKYSNLFGFVNVYKRHSGKRNEYTGAGFREIVFCHYFIWLSDQALQRKQAITSKKKKGSAGYEI